MCGAPGMCEYGGMVVATCTVSNAMSIGCGTTSSRAASTARDRCRRSAQRGSPATEPNHGRHPVPSGCSAGAASPVATSSSTSASASTRSFSDTASRSTR